MADRAAALGFRHATLVWDGEKPAARHSGRGACGALSVDVRAPGRPGHRHAAHRPHPRRSGRDAADAARPRQRAGRPRRYGPGSISRRSAGGSALRLARPLLGVAKERLRATLEARGIGWTEDPSNASPVFERVRLRAARRELDALGLSEAMLALSARRLQRARAALEAVIDSFCAPEAGIVRHRPCGSFRIDRERLAAAPEEIMLRVIGRCITAAGGSGGPVSLAKLELIVARLREGDCGCSRGLDARTRTRRGGRPIHSRRARAWPPAPAGLHPCSWHQGAVGRPFHRRRRRRRSADSIEVRRLGRCRPRRIRRAGLAVKVHVGAAAGRLVLARSELVAVPALDFWADEGLEGRLSGRLRGLAIQLRAPSGMPQTSRPR